MGAALDWGCLPSLGTALQGPLDSETLPLCGRVWAVEEPQAAHSASCHHHCRSHRSLDLTGPLLLGGVPDLPESFPVRTRHFVGCIRNLQVDSRHVDMADFIANNGTVPGMGAWGGARPGAPCTEEWLYLVWRHLNAGSQNPSSHCPRTPA